MTLLPPDPDPEPDREPLEEEEDEEEALPDNLARFPTPVPELPWLKHVLG